MLSAEDRDFYSNPGFSVSGFARAARDNVLGKDTAGGGSTITQQYVKNVLVGADRTLTRKMKELVISSKMAREWSKDEILEAYLNTIYFGRGAYGIAAASQAYFGKPVGDLTVSEGAVLAGVIQTPSSLDPEFNRPAIEARWGYVLDGMVEMGVLSPGDRGEAAFPETVPSDQLARANETPGPEGLIRSQVLRELSAAGISEQVLNTEGLRIVTTIDPWPSKVQSTRREATSKVNPRTCGPPWCPSTRGRVRCGPTTAARKVRVTTTHRRRCRPVRRSRCSVWSRR